MTEWGKGTEEEEGEMEAEEEAEVGERVAETTEIAEDKVAMLYAVGLGKLHPSSSGGQLVGLGKGAIPAAAAVNWVLKDGLGYAAKAMLYAVGLGKDAIPAAAAVNWVLKDGLGYAAKAMLYAVGLGKGAIPAAAAVNWVLKDGQGYAAKAMLYAVGLGKGAIPAAAAVNWVLKDGLGYAAKVTLSQFGRHFDVSPKRWRLTADLVENLSASLELLTATFPQYFVQLAAAAGAGFSASSLVQSATRNRFYAGLAGRRNFAEVLARAEAQGMVSKTLGMALGIAIAPHVGTRGPLLWATHAMLSAMHLFCNYRSYKAVQLRTLNPFRADIVLAEYVTNGRVPGVIDVNSQEPILPPLKTIFSPKALPPPVPGTGSENWIEFGVPLAAVAHTEREAETMAEIFRGEKYLLGRDERTGQMQREAETMAELFRGEKYLLGRDERTGQMQVRFLLRVLVF
ncbi:unnamed protein product [Closterium sp. Naga37s-1]|nr:unnamed protein product [Closterium sp. Naga37s-1]